MSLADELVLSLQIRYFRAWLIFGCYTVPHHLDEALALIMMIADQYDRCFIGSH